MGPTSKGRGGKEDGRKGMRREEKGRKGKGKG